METTQADPVIAEVGAVRDEFAARSNYDLGRYSGGFARCRTSPGATTSSIPRDGSSKAPTSRWLSERHPAQLPITVGGGGKLMLPTSLTRRAVSLLAAPGASVMWEPIDRDCEKRGEISWADGSVRGGGIDAYVWDQKGDFPNFV